MTPEKETSQRESQPQRDFGGFDDVAPGPRPDTTVWSLAIDLPTDLVHDIVHPGDSLAEIGAALHRECDPFVEHLARQIFQDLQVNPTTYEAPDAP